MNRDHAQTAPKFHDFIGQKRVVHLLRRQLAGAQARGEPFPHALFLGPSGVGKSMLSRMLAREYGTGVVEAMGYDDRATLGAKLARLETGDFLLIDECHRLGPAEQELLCEAIDRNSIPALDPKRTDLRLDADGRVAIAAWTLILATDQPGRLLNALDKRVVIEARLDYYDARELKEVVESMASEANILISPQAAKLVAEVSGGLPRRARQTLLSLRLYHPDAEKRQLGVAEVREFLDAFGVDGSGLDWKEVRYLEALGHLGGGSLETVALALGFDPVFVLRRIEPGLVRRGLARVGPSGRQLTCAGREWFARRGLARQVNQPSEDQGHDHDQGG